MPDLEDFRDADQRGRRAASRLEPRLAGAWRPALEAQALTAADNLERYAIDLAPRTAAASWRVPDRDEVLDRIRSQLELRDATADVRADVIRAQMGDVLQVFGLSFDLRNPLIEGVLAQLGRKIVNITESYRAAIMSAIDRAWEAGESIPDTAARIRAEAPGMSGFRATRIARTELIGAVNGGSYVGAKMTGVAAVKQWVATLDSRTRGDHVHAAGQTARIDQGFNVGGVTMLYPGDPSAPAREVVHCRCTMVYPNDLAGMPGVPSSDDILAAASDPAVQARDQRNLQRARASNRR